MAGHFFLSNSSSDPTKPPTVKPNPNGPIHNEIEWLRNVVASATEAEMAGLFYNGQTAVPFINALEEMGYAQPAPPIKSENSTAFGITNLSIRQKKSKAMDMRYCWIQDRCNQGQFLVYWKPGKDNNGDYFTKHHPTSHHQAMRPVYLHQGNFVTLMYTNAKSSMQGCEIPESNPDYLVQKYILI